MANPMEKYFAEVKEFTPGTVVKGKILDKFCYQDPADGAVKAQKSQVPFYQGQHPIVLGKMDLIDPTSLDDYLAAGGYLALQKVFGGMSPEAVIEAVDKSGLRGRGGGGFNFGVDRTGLDLFGARVAFRARLLFAPVGVSPYRRQFA